MDLGESSALEGSNDYPICIDDSGPCLLGVGSVLCSPVKIASPLVLPKCL